MVQFSEFELARLIEDDIYLQDFTTHLQGISRNARLEIFSREDLYLSCIDMVKDIAKMMCVRTLFCRQNSEFIRAKEQIICLESSYENIHKIWKIIQILLEWSCKISTYTHLMVQKAQSVNPNCQILTTRKTFPFAKKLCLKAVIEGGGNIHRKGLDDSILFFENHINAHANFREFCKLIPAFRARMPEKKIIVECSDTDSALAILASGADGVQCDKMKPSDISKIILQRDKSYKNIIVTASGGVNLNNIKEFAQTGINGAITSAPYAQGMADLGAKITLFKS